MSSLAKKVCALYILLSILLGALGAYYVTSYQDVKYHKNISNEKSDNNYVLGNNEQSNDDSNLSETTEISVNGSVKKIKKIKAELTAYCNCVSCSEEWGSRTAMQTPTRVGVIAAPSNIKLGSKLYIPLLKSYKDDGIFDVEDRGGAVIIKDDGTYIIDVWLASHNEVEEFGRKKTEVYLIYE